MGPGFMIKYGIKDNILLQRNLNKGKKLIDMKQYEDAIIVFENVLKKWPGVLQSYMYLAKCAVNLEDWELCLKYTDPVATLLSDYPEIYMLRSIAFIELMKFDEADKLLKKGAEKWPDNLRLYKHRAKLARNANKLDVACRIWKDITTRFPDDLPARFRYIMVLIENNQIDQAYELFRDPELYLEDKSAVLGTAKIHMALYDWDNALKVLRSFPGYDEEKIEARVLEAVVLFKSNQENCLEEAIGILEILHRKYPKITAIKSKLAKYYIFAFRDRDARKLIDQLVAGRQKNSRILILSAWSRYSAGDERQAREIWDGLIQRNLIKRPALDKYKGKLDRVDNNLLPGQPDRIILFTCLKNEVQRLPWFFEYYRKLGVEHFFVVDNGSTDGSTDFLRKQTDVHLFWTEGNYGEAASGMQWINSLVDKYGRDHWCMYLDVDEALIFPGIEYKNLRTVTDYMRSKGHEAFRTFMLDMYPDNTRGIIRKEVDDPMRVSPYFDNNYKFFGSDVCPYIEVKGGIRNNLFQERVSLTKTPIITGNKEIKFLLSSHRITPARVSDMTGVLLHYKLMSDLGQRSLEESEQKNRKYFCNHRHLNYTHVLKKLGDDYSLLNPLTVRYESSEQLVELGLMSKPEDFD